MLFFLILLIKYIHYFDSSLFDNLKSKIFYIERKEDNITNKVIRATTFWYNNLIVGVDRLNRRLLW